MWRALPRSASMRDQTTWQCSRGMPFLSFLTWKTTARGWPASPRRLLGAVDVIEILLPGEPPLPLVGIDREAVEVIGASRQRVRLRLPFGEGAVQVAGDGAPDLRHLHPLVVLRIKKVRGEVLPEGALAAERDHGARSIIFMSAARITVSSSQAGFMRVGSAAVIAGGAAASSRASRIAAERASSCASICFSTAGRRVPRGVARSKRRAW